MRSLAAASQAFVARHFANGETAGTLARAPSLVFSTKDELQARWARRLCHRHVELAPAHPALAPGLRHRRAGEHGLGHATGGAGG